MKTLFEVLEKAHNLIKIIVILITGVSLYFGLKMETQDLRADIREWKKLYDQDKQFQSYRVAQDQKEFDNLRNDVIKNTEKISLINQQLAFLRPEEITFRNRANKR